MTIYSNSPIARRTMETFAQFVDVGGSRQRVEFQREIVWLVESTSQPEFLHGGEVLHEGSASGDYYGFLTSISAKDASELALTYAIDAASTLELRVQTSISLVPHFENDECKKYNATKQPNYKSKWDYVPNDWRQERVDPDSPEGHLLHPMIEPIVLVAPHTTWSSKRSEQENVAFIEQFVSEWKRVVESGRLATMDLSTAQHLVPRD